MGFIFTLLKWGVATAVAAYTIMTRKDWIDHRTEPLTLGELSLAVKRLIALEADDYAVYSDYEAHEVPVVEYGSQIHVYVPEDLLGLTPDSAGVIARKLSRNVAGSKGVTVHEYEDEAEVQA